MYIVIAILLFGVFIAVHELGHFAVAKLCGIRVIEFAIGMGPKLLKRQGKETLYTWRALPIGGFCAMEGEDAASNDPRAFTNQNVWKRTAVLLAGSFMNFVFGILLILAVFSQTEAFTTPQITGFMQGSPYEGADGLLEGDIIYKINGERIYFSANVSTYLELGDGQGADIVVIRDGEKITLEDFPIALREYTDENGEKVIRYGLYFGVRESGTWAKLKYSWYCAVDFVRMVRISLAALFSGAVGVRDLSGPVGIVGIMNDVGRESASFAEAMLNIAYFSAFISINLAVMNLLPIPALDGGRILFLFISRLIERVSRRKLNPKYEGYIHGVTYVLLIGLMVFVMFNDIVKLVAGGV